VSEQEVRTGLLLGQILRKWFRRATPTLDFAAQADELRLRGDLEAAEAVCAQGLASFPTYASAHVVMGDILRARGLLDAAEAEWNEARRLHPEHPQVNLRLAQLYLARGQVARAMAALELSLLSSPGSQEARSLLAQAVTTRPGASEPQPSWLRPQRYRELLSSVGSCPSVTGVALVGATGEVVSGALSPVAAGLAATLMLESRPLMERIGAGPLRAALLRGRERDRLCFEVDGQALVVDLVAGTPVGAVRREIQGTVAALRRRWEDVRTEHASAAAA
jgi:predicted regulator of Ras-like GTPase activity (Roadblock/LC7/MglB family)